MVRRKRMEVEEKGKSWEKWEETAGKDVCENGKGRVRTGRKRG